jgi:hypothetical protein
MGPPQSDFHVENGSDEEAVLGFAEPGERHVGAITLDVLLIIIGLISPVKK